MSAIDISAISLTDKTFAVTPKLPEGVRLIDNFETFEVTINTNNYDEKVLTITQIKTIGLDKGLKSNQTSIKNVKICGPSAVIRKITADKITAKIDLSNKLEGQHTVDAVFSLKDYKNVWVVGTYTSTVTITKK